MSQAPRIFRRRFLIHRELQLPFVGIMLMLALLTGLQMLAQVLWLNINVVEKAAEYGLKQDILTTAFIIVQRKELLLRLFAFLGLNLLLIGIFAFFYSHRVSGPIYRLEKALKNLADSDALQEIHFRRNDLFHGLAEHFNAAIRKLRDKQQSERQTLKTIHEKLQAGKGDQALHELHHLLNPPTT